MLTRIIQAKPDSPEAVSLIAELDAHLGSHDYPQASRHGYPVEKLLREAVAFFVVRQDEVPAGCGGVQLCGAEYAELKRMFVRPVFRRLGLGKLLLNHLAEYARQAGAAALRLETGIHEAAAIGMYESFGFRRRPPFGEYREDPFSVYYEKELV